MTQDTLRERGKARRRGAIELSALRLFAEQGYDATTVAQIAEDAEVSLRTVWTYFPTKLDLVHSRAEQAALRLAAALDDRPPGPSVLDTIVEWMRNDPIFTDGETLPMYAAMFAKNPDIRAAHGGQFPAAESALTRALAQELDADPDSTSVRTARGAIWGVLTEYVRGSESAEGPVSEADTHASLAFLRAGLAALT